MTGHAYVTLMDGGRLRGPITADAAGIHFGEDVEEQFINRREEPEWRGVGKGRRTLPWHRVESITWTEEAA